jgi:hypothetical protein
VTTPVIDPVNGYNTGFTATPAIAFGNSLCFNHGMPSRRRQQGNPEGICLSVLILQGFCTIGNSSPSPLHALSVGQICSEGMDFSLPRFHPVTHPCKRIECRAFAWQLKSCGDISKALTSITGCLLACDIYFGKLIKRCMP